MDQESINEKSYAELLLGKPKLKKDPRFSSLKKLRIKKQILSSRKKDHNNHIINQIEFLRNKIKNDISEKKT